MPSPRSKPNNEKRHIVNAVEALVKKGVNKLEAIHRHGISDATFYKWRKQLGLKPDTMLTPRSTGESETVLQFQVIPADQAKSLTVNMNKGRFMHIKEALVTQLGTLRRTEALKLPLAENMDDKERQNLGNALKHVIRIQGLPYKVRYSKLQKCLVVIHASRFERKNGVEK